MAWLFMGALPPRVTCCVSMPDADGNSPQRASKMGKARDRRCGRRSRCYACVSARRWWQLRRPVPVQRASWGTGEAVGPHTGGSARRGPVLCHRRSVRRSVCQPRAHRSQREQELALRLRVVGSMFARRWATTTAPRSGERRRWQEWRSSCSSPFTMMNHRSRVRRITGLK